MVSAPVCKTEASPRVSTLRLFPYLLSRLLHVLSEFCYGILKALSHKLESSVSKWVMKFRIASFTHPKFKGAAYIPSHAPKGSEPKPGVLQNCVTKITDIAEFSMHHIDLTSQRLALWLRIFNWLSQMGQAPFCEMIEGRNYRKADALGC